MLSVVEFRIISIDKCQLQEPPCKVIESVAEDLLGGVQTDAQNTGNQLKGLSG